VPESKGRKLKKRKAASQSTRPKAAAPKHRLGKVIGAAFTVIVGIVGLSVLWPRLTVEPTGTSEPSNPFSGIFKVANLQNYPLSDVRIEAFLWCNKIGRGTDTSPPTMCERGMASSRSEWNHRTIAADDSYQVEVGDVLFATPSALLFADISIKVTFDPWMIPFHFRREFRFYTHRRDDGIIEWLHKPLEG
jgi:hypothetical protein